jgi:hypothetical protein
LNDKILDEPRKQVRSAIPGKSGKDDYIVARYVDCHEIHACEVECILGSCLQNKMNTWVCPVYDLAGNRHYSAGTAVRDQKRGDLAQGLDCRVLSLLCRLPAVRVEVQIPILGEVIDWRGEGVKRCQPLRFTE